MRFVLVNFVNIKVDNPIDYVQCMFTSEQTMPNISSVRDIAKTHTRQIPSVRRIGSKDRIGCRSED